MGPDALQRREGAGKKQRSRNSLNASEVGALYEDGGEKVGEGEAKHEEDIQIRIPQAPSSNCSIICPGLQAVKIPFPHF